MEAILTPLNVINRTRRNRQKDILNLRCLRLSLKYRPEILKLILKMRQCIKKKNDLILKLKNRLKSTEKDVPNSSNPSIKVDNESSHNIANDTEVKEGFIKNDSITQDTIFNRDTTSNKMHIESETSNITILTKDSYTQTDESSVNNDSKCPTTERTSDKEPTAWVVGVDNGEKEKSIAEQVKEAAQSAMQQSGMVYVESAGMYYDYKTGYYYNSELGLYYHTDTGCYYYYSEDKQTFVFHSYPDRGAVNVDSSMAVHEHKKARKHKKTPKTEDEIENLTKNLSQDNGEDASDQASEPKRRKKHTKKKTGLSSKKHINITLNSKNDAKEDENTIIQSKEKTKDVSKSIKDEIKVDSEIETDMFSSEHKESNENKQAVGDEELEDGECSETDSEKSNEEDNESDASTSTASDDASVAKHHPPCMRVIVRETNLPKLKVGSLFLVTKDGGTVGREGEQHTILIRDTNVSRNHLDIKYDIARKMYMVIDLGSKNGTILNGSRMSASQIISEPMEVLHGSTIQLGETKLLCHIHPGNDTCGHCEPGLIMDTQEKEKKIAYTRTCSVQKQHQLELARLKNKYAPKPLSIEPAPYNDRAQARRETVGSSHHSEKTQSSDLETFIAPENKGFKLLEKMGWSKGEGLGKDSQGDTEPIPLVSNEGKTGLGNSGSVSTPSMAPTISASNSLGPATLRLASRTKMLKPPAKAFQDPLDDDSE